LRRDIENPDAFVPIVLVDYATIVLLAFAALPVLGDRLLHQDCDPFSVRGPAERLDALLAIGDPLGLAAGERQEIELRASIAIRRERDRGSIRSPSRRRVVLPGEGQLAHASAGDVEQP